MPISGFKAGLTTRLNEVDNRLRLEQIQPTVEESAAGKFPGSSEGSPPGNSGLDQTFENDYAPVAADLNGIFSGIGPGSLQDPAQPGIHRPAFDNYLPKLDPSNPFAEGGMT